MKRYNIIIALVVVILILLVLATNLYLDIKVLNNNTINDLELGSIINGIVVTKSIFLVIILGLIAAVINIAVSYYKTSQRVKQTLDEALQELDNVLSEAIKDSRKECNEVEVPSKEYGRVSDKDLFIRKDEDLDIPKRTDFSLDDYQGYNNAMKEWSEKTMGTKKNINLGKV